MTDNQRDKDEQLAAAREVMARREQALADLADMKIAERIMEEDREILRALSKS